MSMGFRPSASPVHPRVRGERTIMSLSCMAVVGSSPRSRGTVALCPIRPPIGRFIPAFAGNGSWSGSAPAIEAVHPRVRGERHAKEATARVDVGSSPRSRGTAVGIAECECAGRFIPAFAGNGSAMEPVTCPRPVHPRVRGERVLAVQLVGIRSGSSPRSRGTVHAYTCEYSTGRFIPAFAGNGKP